MDWTSLFLKAASVVLPDLLTKLGPTLAPVIGNVVSTFKGTTAPVPAGTPPVPAPVGSTLPKVVGKPSVFIKNAQHLTNQYLKPVPPLVEDGWLGTKTETVWRNALATYGIVI